MTDFKKIVKETDARTTFISTFSAFITLKKIRIHNRVVVTETERPPSDVYSKNIVEAYKIT